MDTEYFVGEYDRSVDGNGRVALPADFRDEFDGQCYLTAHPDGFVKIMSPAQFAVSAGDVLDEVRDGRGPESSRRALGAGTMRATIDKQGRITLDDRLRAHAGLADGGAAVIAGALTSLELWRASRYQTIRSEDAVEQQVRVWDDEDEA